MATLAHPSATAEHIQQLEQKIAAARQSIADLPGEDFYSQLLVIIHRPGWTSKAEGLFFEAAVDSIATHAKHLATAHRQLLAASQQVGK